MELSHKISQNNFYSFLWHGTFSAFAINFMDIHTVIPSMLLKAGGNSIHLGIMTAIMMGGATMMRIVFASFLSNKPLKKSFLLWGINLRVLSLAGIGLLLMFSSLLSQWLTIFLIFLLISFFSFSGSFAVISYMDIFGKSILFDRRKTFFSIRQVISGIAFFISAFAVKKLLVVYEYPESYTFLFFIAGFLLLFSSLGFWKIKEIKTEIKHKKGFLEFFKLIPAMIKKDDNLKFYLLMLNTVGLGLSFMPFLVLLAKENYGLTNEMVGDFLIFRTIGIVPTALILFKLSKKFKYKNLLLISITLGIVIPITALLMKFAPDSYKYIYILVGIFVTTFRVSVEGILIDISNDENRATYAGISGAGRIIPMIFPLIAGVSITALGYNVVFIFVSLLILTGLFFVLKLNCSVRTE